VSLLDDIIARGAEIRARLRQLLPRHATADTKTDWLIASMDIALEHHEAVERLAKSNLNGSAFSMVRLVFDTYLRSLWLNAYATEARMKQACRDKLKWPKMEEMRDEIKQAYYDEADSPEEAARRDNFFQILKDGWPIMCDYTHSGSRQIAWRFTNNELKPAYSEGAVAEAVNLTTVAVLMMTGVLFARIGPKEKAEEILTRLADYAREFGKPLRAAAIEAERLRTGQ
jgi:hypothetical protein